jgi:8-oxo-dGTP diphosphatase
VTVRYERGVDAYVVCRDPSGRTLLVPAGDDRWTLPGGAVRHGEHPADAVARWVAEQTGQGVAGVRARTVMTEIDESPDARIHRDQIVFEGTAVAISADGDWFSAKELDGLRLTAGTGYALGLRQPATDSHQVETVTWAATPGESPTRRQRFAAYAFATDPSGHVLLTLIAPGYPGAGRWHLPGGGTDFGESAEAGLLREIVEETSQEGEIGPLVSVSHRHQPSVLGPEGVPMDWHGIRVIYRVRVAEPTTPRVMDGGGSTAAAAWFSPARAAELSLTEVALAVVREVNA